MFIFKHPIYFLWRLSRHPHDRLFIIGRSLLGSCRREHWDNAHAYWRSFQCRRPITVKNWKTDVTIWIHMLVLWRLSNKYDFWRFNGVFTTELKLERIGLSHIDTTLCSNKFDMPEHLSLVHHLKLQDSGIVIIDILSFFSKTS